MSPQVKDYMKQKVKRKSPGCWISSHLLTHWARPPKNKQTKKKAYGIVNHTTQLEYPSDLK